MNRPEPVYANPFKIPSGNIYFKRTGTGVTMERSTDSLNVQVIRYNF
jgi:hypothetical protein